MRPFGRVVGYSEANLAHYAVSLWAASRACRMAVREKDTHRRNWAFMIRRVTSIALLFVLAGLQAVPLAGSLCAATPNCCTGVMCPMHQQMPDRQGSRKIQLDCSGTMPSDHSNQECSAGSCSYHHNHAVGLGSYVFPRPASLAVIFAASSLAKTALKPELAASQTPDPPPPQF
jgi:hypothetical protein